MNAPVSLLHEGREGELWHALLDIAEQRRGPWTLVGALMVSLRAAHAGRTMPRATQDIDAVVEVRGVASEPRTFAQDLTELGWDIPTETIGSDGIGHRFYRGDLCFDLLVPEGLGEHADLTTIPPLVTVPIPGATQALRRTELVDVIAGERVGRLPCPSLLGAIVLKSCAAAGQRQSSDKPHGRHGDDLALLYSLVTDPISLRDACGKADLRRIRRAGDPNWSMLPAGLAADARAARAIILGD